MPPTFPHGRKEGRGPIAVLCRVRDVFPAGFYVSAGLKWPRRDSLRVAAHRDEPDAKFENATCARRASAERSSPAHREEHDGDSLRPRAAHGRVGSVPRTGAAGPAPRRSHARARAPRESLARPGQRECGEQPAPRRRLEVSTVVVEAQPGAAPTMWAGTIQRRAIPGQFREPVTLGSDAEPGGDQALTSPSSRSTGGRGRRRARRERSGSPRLVLPLTGAGERSALGTKWRSASACRLRDPVCGAAGCVRRLAGSRGRGGQKNIAAPDRVETHVEPSEPGARRRARRSTATGVPSGESRGVLRPRSRARLRFRPLAAIWFSAGPRCPSCPSATRPG